MEMIDLVQWFHDGTAESDYYQLAVNICIQEVARLHGKKNQLYIVVIKYIQKWYKIYKN